MDSPPQHPLSYICTMTYESEGQLMLDRLRQRWGDEPGWILRPNKEYGFFLLYRRGLASLGEVRELIDTTFGFSGPTFIIGELPEPTRDE